MRKANVSAAAGRAGGGKQRRLSWSPNVAALLPAAPSQQLPGQQRQEGVRRSTSARSLEQNANVRAGEGADIITAQMLAGGVVASSNLTSSRALPHTAGIAGASAAAARGAAGYAPSATPAMSVPQYGQDVMQASHQLHGQHLYGRHVQGPSGGYGQMVGTDERSVYLEQSESSHGDWRKALRELSLDTHTEENTIDFGHLQQQQQQQLLGGLLGHTQQSDLMSLLQQHQQQQHLLDEGMPGQQQHGGR